MLGSYDVIPSVVWSGTPFPHTWLYVLIVWLLHGTELVWFNHVLYLQVKERAGKARWWWRRSRIKEGEEKKAKGKWWGLLQWVEKDLQLKELRHGDESWKVSLLLFGIIFISLSPSRPCLSVSIYYNFFLCVSLLLRKLLSWSKRLDPVCNGPYSQSRTGTSLQWRLMQGNIIKRRQMSFTFDKNPRIN